MSKLQDALQLAQGYHQAAEARRRDLENGLLVILAAVRGDEKSSCWPIRKWLDDRDIFNGDLGSVDRLVEEVCKALLLEACLSYPDSLGLLHAGETP